MVKLAHRGFEELSIYLQTSKKILEQIDKLDSKCINALQGK